MAESLDGAKVVLVGLGEAAALVRHGRILGFDGQVYEVEVAGDPLRPGITCILDSGHPDEDFAEVRVLAADGNRVRLALERSRPRDKRLDDRVDVPIAFTWHQVPAVPAAEAAKAWAEGGTLPPEAGPPRRPGTPLNLSASGLAFDDRDPPAPGEGVLVALEVEAGVALRLAGRVVHVRDLSTAERAAHPQVPSDARHVAVELVEVAPATRQALLELVVDRQRLPGETAASDEP